MDVVEDGPAEGQKPDKLGALAGPEAFNDEAGAREGALGLGSCRAEDAPRSPLSQKVLRRIASSVGFVEAPFVTSRLFSKIGGKLLRVSMALIILCTHIPVQVGVRRSENTSGKDGILENSERALGEALVEVRGEDQDRTSRHDRSCWSPDLRRRCARFSLSSSATSSIGFCSR